jgi:hypothetical protein
MTEYAKTISSGIFFNIFYVNMPELLVLAFFLIFFYVIMTGTISSGVFFNIFLYKYAGTISSGIFFLINYILKNIFAMFFIINIFFKLKYSD